ncbi:MAG: hydrolase [Frankiales bacterium]|nr:hydrolase [Frankiales bacterium]
MELERLQVRAFRALPEALKMPAIRLGTPNFTVGSLTWLTDDGKRVLLTRPSYRQGWLPTGGFLRKGETPLETVTREVQEELGVVADVEPHHRVAFDVERRGVTFVSAGLLPRSMALVLSAEILETRWFPVDDLPPFPSDFSEGFTVEDRAAITRLAR